MVSSFASIATAAARCWAPWPLVGAESASRQIRHGFPVVRSVMQTPAGAVAPSGIGAIGPLPLPC